jgi:hypothetical protein
MHTISTEVKAKIQRPGCVLLGMFDELREYVACEHRRLSHVWRAPTIGTDISGWHSHALVRLCLTEGAFGEKYVCLINVSLIIQKP